MINFIQFFPPRLLVIFQLSHQHFYSFHVSDYACAYAYEVDSVDAQSRALHSPSTFQGQLPLFFPIFLFGAVRRSMCRHRLQMP